MQAQHEDAWIPVGLEGQFAPSSSHPVIVNGYGLAVWRGATGQVQVWEDRCPHRGMRLSFGFVRGERLVCLYHGWEYGQGGQCGFIPAHPELEPPKTICAKTYAMRSHRGIVYTNLAAAPSAVWPEDPAAGWHPVRSLYVAVPLDRVHDYLSGGKNVFAAAATSGELDGFEVVMPDTGRISLALQPVETDLTAIHITCESGDAAARQRLARLLVRMRRELEK